MNNDDAATVQQTNTQQGTGRDIASLVQDDIEKRAELGQKRYGERLRSHNGRDPLVDAYQEALDLALYLKQELEERDSEQPS